MAGLINGVLEGGGLKKIDMLGEGKAYGYDPNLLTVNEADTVSGRLNTLLSEKNTGPASFIQNARTAAEQAAREAANAGGLLNTSMAIGAARGASDTAAYNAALPIASQDSSTLSTQRLTNQGAINTASQFSAGEANRMGIIGVGAEAEKGLIEARTAGAAKLAAQKNTFDAAMAKLNADLQAGVIIPAEYQKQSQLLTQQNAAEIAKINAQAEQQSKLQAEAAAQAERLQTQKGTQEKDLFADRATLEKDLEALKAKSASGLSAQEAAQLSALTAQKGQIDKEIIEKQRTESETLNASKALLDEKFRKAAATDNYTLQTDLLSQKGLLDTQLQTLQGNQQKELQKQKADIDLLLQSEKYVQTADLNAQELEARKALQDRKAEIDRDLATLQADRAELRDSQAQTATALLNANNNKATADLQTALQTLKGTQAEALTGLENGAKAAVAAGGDISRVVSGFIDATTKVQSDPNLTEEQRKTATQTLSDQAMAYFAVVKNVTGIDATKDLNFAIKT